MTPQEANKIIADIIGQKILITKEDWSSQVATIKRVIPMHGKDRVNYDVEILINKARNHYFSINSLKQDRSWVRKIKFLGVKDKGLRKLKSQPVARYIMDFITDESLISTAKAIEGLK